MSQYAIRSFTIPANGTVSYSRPADFLSCLEAGGDGLFLVRFDDGSANDFEAGLTIKPEAEFKRIELINETSSAMVVRLAFGRGDITDSRLSIQGSIKTQEIVPDTFITYAPAVCPSGANTLTSSQNSDRSRVILRTLADAPGTVFVTHALSSGAGAGLPLEPGESLTLETSDGVYIRNDTGSDVTVYYGIMRFA